MKRQKDDRPPGELYVWLSAMGLTVGIAMIACFLGLILWNGLHVFWPDPIAHITLKEGAATRIGDAHTLGGAIIKKQKKVLGATDKTTRPSWEWQLFTGNKDRYRFMYHYIDAADIAELAYPESIMVAERLEYGDAIFFPVALRHSDERTLLATDAEFLPTLHRLLDEVTERRKKIHEVEKKEIGIINYRMEKLRLEQRRLKRKQAQEAIHTTDEIDTIQSQLEALQTHYEILATEASELRQRQYDATLVYRLPTGEEHTLPIGAIVSVYQPNRLSLLDKLQHFATHFYRFLSEEPREANTEGGIFPAIFGTFVMTVLMSISVMPFGVLAAIYLREYASQGPWVRSVRIAVNNLAGVPSIVFGVFGLGFFIYFLGGSIDRLFFSERLPTPTFGTGGILWASLTLALMTVPVVIVATEEALASVPRGVREASLACGASKWQTLQRVVLPAAAPGILTGLILAMARGAGEVAPLMLVGVVKLAPSLPFDSFPPFIHLDRKFMHLGFHIYDLGFQSPDSEAAKPMVFATTFLLILLVLILNLGAILIRNHLRKKYSIGVF